ncbi:MAG: DJ-1/PfpI family protein [Rickettsiales bacterium]|nr:DJ-1/PfpI family protein [Rickettsiales bacterium]
MLESVPSFIFLVFGAFALSDIAAIYFFYTRWQKAKELQIASLGHEVTGTIKEKSTISGKHGASYKVDYSFEDWRGHSHDGSQTIPEHMWNIMKPEDDVRIVYVRSRPNTNSLAKRVDKHVENSRFIFRILLLTAIPLPILFFALISPYANF